MQLALAQLKPHLQKGLKSLYYCRSKSVQRASFAGSEKERTVGVSKIDRTDYEECLACQ